MPREMRAQVTSRTQASSLNGTMLSAVRVRPALLKAETVVKKANHSGLTLSLSASAKKRGGGRYAVGEYGVGAAVSVVGAPQC